MAAPVIEQILPFFRARAWYPHPHGWPFWIVATALDRTREDLRSLIGHEVIVDAALYRCLGVERFLHSSPWLRDEEVGLMVAAGDRPWPSL